MKNTTESFYDVFGRRFIRDYVLGNRRVDRQLAFLTAAVPATAEQVLVIGCGAGEAAHLVASTIARGSRVLAVDISGENLRLARALHSHPRVTYQKHDVLNDPLDGTFDVIILPDVYEHIPLDKRASLHRRLGGLLRPNGRVLLTVPSPGKQASLSTAVQGLQIIDEVVTVSDLVSLSHDVGGELNYLNLISVWETNDYMHASIDRAHNRVAPVRASMPLPIQYLPPRISRFQRFGKRGRLTRLIKAPFRYLTLRVRMWRN